MLSNLFHDRHNPYSRFMEVEYPKDYRNAVRAGLIINKKFVQDFLVNNTH